jgi:hypothetical protein
MSYSVTCWEQSGAVQGHFFSRKQYDAHGKSAIYHRHWPHSKSEKWSASNISHHFWGICPITCSYPRLRNCLSKLPCSCFCGQCGGPDTIHLPSSLRGCLSLWPLWRSFYWFVAFCRTDVMEPSYTWGMRMAFPFSVSRESLAPGANFIVLSWDVCIMITLSCAMDLMYTVRENRSDAFELFHKRMILSWTYQVFFGGHGEI